ncbi:hypothetical protein HPP92_004318 [Vanilla planifolia]|uniref:Uncharacterized protein n=1 Tax=Vanilla planifolia TaxID=51239 RepID=A0A835RKU5_VANPL|nr:hypothetical protein HPP92_004318 [Vanilla planifolia]
MEEKHGYWEGVTIGNGADASDLHKAIVKKDSLGKDAKNGSRQRKSIIFYRSLS